MRTNPFNNPAMMTNRPPLGGKGPNPQETMQQSLVKLLPSIADNERQQVREQILETLQKDMDHSEILKVIEHNSINGGGSSGADHGEHSGSDMNVIEIVV
jgi:hypothetical protein